MVHLLVATGPDAGTVFPLTGVKITLGRSPENDIVLNDNTTSRAHATILVRDGRYYVRDLGSTHGTFVNEVRNNRELLLSPGDHVRFGETDLVFREGDPAAAADGGKVHGREMSESIVDLPGEETISYTLSADTHAGGKELSEQHWENITRVAKATQSVLDLDDLLAALMGVLFEVFMPDRGIVYLRDRETGDLTPAVIRPEGGAVTVSHSVINQAIDDRVSLLVGDTAEDQRFSGAQSIVTQAILSAICAPLVSKDEVLGVIYLDTQSHLIRYDKEHLALLNIIAANAAIAIENARLVREKVESERLAAIGVAVAGISHYVKNIVAGIVGSSSLIEHGLKGEDLALVTKAWPVLQRSTAKISDLVQDMLSYSKKREPNWENGNLNDLLHEIFEDQAGRAAELGVAFEENLDATLPASRFDKRAMHDTLLNIVGNGIEASAAIPGATVVLESSYIADKRMLRVRIRDTGPGMPAEIQSKIFEPFFSTKGSKGTGLGLAVARKAVEEHGGRLLLESEVGKGTTFTVLLPPDEKGVQPASHGSTGTGQATR